MYTGQKTGSLFKDRYGILRLAADATLTKVPISSKAPFASLKLMQWANNILMIIKKLWRQNPISCCDFIWVEPSELTYQVVREERIQRTEKKHG